MSKSIGRDFAVAFAGQGMAALQGLIVLPIMIRLAGEATYGAFVMTFNFVVILLGLLGTVTSYRYRRGLVSATGFDQRRRLFEPQFTFQILALSFVSLAFLLVGPEMQSFLFSGSVQFASSLFVLLLVSQLLLRQVQDYFQYTHRFLPGSIIYGGRPYVFVAILGIVAAVARGLSLDTLLSIQAAATLCVCAPFLPTMLREIGVARLRLPFAQLIDDARMGFPLTLELIIDFVLGFSDRYLICLFLSVADVGRYQPAYTLGSVVIIVITLADTVLLPALARMVDLGNQARANHLFAGFLKLFLMVAIPFAVGALMVGATIIGLLTNPQIGVASRWVGPLVATGAIFYGVMRLASLIAYVLGRVRLILGANLVGAGLNLALNLGLLAVFPDITVPAATTLIGYAAGCGYVAVSLRPVWPLQIAWRAVLRFCAAAAAMAGLLWLLGYRPAALVATSPLALAAAILAAAVGYFLVLGALGGFGRREIAQIASLLRREPTPDSKAI